jgi:cAMP-binding proteins - catabolite gene activator and regulatory subunit of cAMP-dependent protein kinases
VSIVDSTVYAISCGVFLERLEQNPELNQILMRILCRKNPMLIGRLLSQSSTVALQRIAQTLIDMAQEYGIETEDGLEISIRFSHQDVANLLHTSRVTVTKAFQSMTQAGILLRKDNRILVRDRERLIQLAAGTLSL